MFDASWTISSGMCRATQARRIGHRATFVETDVLPRGRETAGRGSLAIRGEVRRLLVNGDRGRIGAANRACRGDLYEIST